MNGEHECYLCTFEITYLQKERLETASLKKRVEGKVADFDVQGAVRLLCSEDSFAPMNQDTLNQLKLKHPSPSRSLNFPSRPNAELSLQVSEVNIKRFNYVFW